MPSGGMQQSRSTTASKLECPPLVLRQQMDEEPAMASWSAFPTGWPDVALMLCFCKPVGRAFSDGGSPSLQKPWEEVGQEPPRRVGGKGRTMGPGSCQAVWGWCPELSLYLAVMLTECEKKDVNSPYPTS